MRSPTESVFYLFINELNLQIGVNKLWKIGLENIEKFHAIFFQNICPLSSCMPVAHWKLQFRSNAKGLFKR